MSKNRIDHIPRSSGIATAVHDAVELLLLVLGERRLRLARRARLLLLLRNGGGPGDLAARVGLALARRGVRLVGAGVARDPTVALEAQDAGGDARKVRVGRAGDEKAEDRLAGVIVRAEGLHGAVREPALVAEVVAIDLVQGVAAHPRDGFVKAEGQGWGGCAVLRVQGADFDEGKQAKPEAAQLDHVLADQREAWLVGPGPGGRLQLAAKKPRCALDRVDQVGRWVCLSGSAGHEPERPAMPQEVVALGRGRDVVDLVGVDEAARRQGDPGQVGKRGGHDLAGLAGRDGGRGGGHGGLR